MGSWPDPIRLHAPGCIAGTPLTDPAHAHVRGPLRGWICFQTTDPDADPLLVIHEVAHVIAGTTGHTTRWMEIYARLGGPALRSVRDPATMTRFSR